MIKSTPLSLWNPIDLFQYISQRELDNSRNIFLNHLCLCSFALPYCIKNTDTDLSLNSKADALQCAKFRSNHPAVVLYLTSFNIKDRHIHTSARWSKYIVPYIPLTILINIMYNDIFPKISNNKIPFLVDGRHMDLIFFSDHKQRLSLQQTVYRTFWKYS